MPVGCIHRVRDPIWCRPDFRFAGSRGMAKQRRKMDHKRQWAAWAKNYRPPGTAQSHKMTDCLCQVATWDTYVDDDGRSHKEVHEGNRWWGFRGDRGEGGVAGRERGSEARGARPSPEHPQIPREASATPGTHNKRRGEATSKLSFFQDAIADCKLYKLQPRCTVLFSRRLGRHYEASSDFGKLKTISKI